MAFGSKSGHQAFSFRNLTWIWVFIIILTVFTVLGLASEVEVVEAHGSLDVAGFVIRV